MAATRIRERRKTCYWEETYDPNLVGALIDGDWDFTHERGPTKRFFEASSLVEFLKSGGERIFKSVIFTECDFQGHFYHDAQIVFDGCHFNNCDLSLSTWENIKFSACHFNNASLGQAILKNCEFRSCSWAKLALSPNGTELYNTYVSNPLAFISAASTNLNEAVLAEHGKDPRTQALRLENTKATIARRLLKMLQQEGGEDAFYESVQTFLLQNATSEMATRMLKKESAKGRWRKIIFTSQWLGWAAEREVIRSFGLVNRWGASVVRPVGFMILCFVIFAILYWAASPTHVVNPFQRSFDIVVLAGYSIYGNEQNNFVQVMQNLQVTLSIIFYSLFFATVINRVSRVR